MNIDNILYLIIHHPDPKVRKNAAEELLNSGILTRHSLEAFAQGLCDIDDGVKDICARALANAPQNKYSDVASVMAPLIAHNNIEIRNLASDILTKIGIDAIDSIIPFLEDSNSEVRQFAVDILGRIGNPSVLFYMYDMLKDPVNVVRSSTVEAIGNMRNPESVAVLTDIYGTDEDLNPVIIEALGKIGGRTAQDFLLRTLREEKDLFIQTTCIDALALGGEDINICDNLLKELPNSSKELQLIILKTISAIAFRLGHSLELPENMRYIAYRAFEDNDPDIKIAGLIALGQSYIIQDIEYLITIILENNPDIQQLILSNILDYSKPEVVESFFQELFNLTEYHYTTIIEVLSLMPMVWNDSERENSAIAINTFIKLLTASDIQNPIEFIELFRKADYLSVIESLRGILDNGSLDQIEIALNIIENIPLKEFLVDLENYNIKETFLQEKVKQTINILSNS